MVALCNDTRAVNQKRWGCKSVFVWGNWEKPRKAQRWQLTTGRRLNSGRTACEDGGLTGVFLRAACSLKI